MVGPRPCLPYEYKNILPRHRERCVTLPGLTGLWQTVGNRTLFEEMNRFGHPLCQTQVVSHAT